MLIPIDDLMQFVVKLSAHFADSNVSDFATQQLMNAIIANNKTTPSLPHYHYLTLSAVWLPW